MQLTNLENTEEVDVVSWSLPMTLVGWLGFEVSKQVLLTLKDSDSARCFFVISSWPRGKRPYVLSIFVV